ncbi:glycosyltransferase [Lactobacillus delbrueckii]|uniref:glycosyltransferase n=1 Tax=Lactobacillus delbrueckii TaxID=1584 RepID=UPI0030EA4EA8
MRVLLVNSTGLADNGISTFVINNAKLLANKPDVKVAVLAPNKVDEGIKGKLTESNVQLFEIPDRNSHPVKYFNQMLRVLRHEKFDVVHVNGSSNIMSIELAAAFFAGVKIRAAHSHNTVTEHQRIHNLLRIPFNMFVNMKIACNEASGKWLFGNKSFTVIDNGIFLDDYRYNQINHDNIRKQLGVKSKDVLLGHVGYFNEQKNQAFLLDVLKDLPEKYKLVMIGAGHDFEEVKAKTKELGLTHRVIFTGSVNNVPDYLSAMDMFVLPSRFEGQPFVVVEASANGLPIILSDKISREINLTGKLKFVSLDPKAWVEEIQQTALPSRDNESNDNIKRLAAQGYDAVKNAEDLYELYVDRMKE